jgi:hypothetical protein
MESRVRVVLVTAGLPPEVQYPVILNSRRYRLGLAYPAQRVAVEYDGEARRLPARARRDLAREAISPPRGGGCSVSARRW